MVEYLNTSSLFVETLVVTSYANMVCTGNERSFGEFKCHRPENIIIDYSLSLAQKHLIAFLRFIGGVTTVPRQPEMSSLGAIFG